MSSKDREKWNTRYADGAYSERTHASALLRDWIDRIEPGKALDMACGAGRNTLWLAEQGFTVDGVDISAAGLARLQATADERGLAVNLIEHDLDEPLELADDYQLILVIRYVNLPLLTRLTQHLAPGGWLICEQHMLSDAEVIGPSTPAFRVAPGALSTAVPGLEVQSLREGLVTEPDGRLAALSRLVARRPATLQEP
ncbi:MAG: methyltransferase domain-containing protein [Halieaceae bacterium]|nr:methyltransferase domain-containing protein [Halieaceae bacterium]